MGTFDTVEKISDCLWRLVWTKSKMASIAEEKIREHSVHDDMPRKETIQVFQKDMSNATLVLQLVT